MQNVRQSNQILIRLLEKLNREERWRRNPAAVPAGSIFKKRGTPRDGSAGTERH